MFLIKNTCSSDIAQLRILIFRFDIEEDLDCFYDYIQVIQNNKKGKKYCGNTKPPDVYATNGTLTLLFHSDGSDTATGFEALIVPTGKEDLNCLKRGARTGNT